MLKIISIGVLLLTLAQPVLYAAPGGGAANQARSWSEYLELMKELQQLESYTVAGESVNLAQFYLMNLANGYSVVFNADSEYPEFLPYLNHVFNGGAPNPDNTYYLSAIDGHNSYRISGHRGTVHMIIFQSGYDYFGFSEIPGRTSNAKEIDDFHINTDGSFEILLSSKKPEGYQGNWMYIAEQDNYLSVRMVTYHPDEIDARMAIEKIGKPSRPADSLDVDKRLQAAIDYARLSARDYIYWPNKLLEEGVINRLVIPEWVEVGGVVSQIYEHGIYDVEYDEALVITVKVPECKYTNIQVADLLWRTPHYLHHQSDLNGHVDRADADGLTRYVLSHQDPGVANWIDLDGVKRGYMLMRWVQCNARAEPALEKVNLDKLDNYLPNDTKSVSPQEREQVLRERSRMKQMKRDW